MLDQKLYQVLILAARIVKLWCAIVEELYQILILAARIKDAQISEQESQIASKRKNLIGSGDRSERIRTYNFPQGRISDHRINLTLYKIDLIMDGDLNELIEALNNEHQADLLAQLNED